MYKCVYHTYLQRSICIFTQICESDICTYVSYISYICIFTQRCTNVCIIHIYKYVSSHRHTCLFKWLSGGCGWVFGLSIVAPILDLTWYLIWYIAIWYLIYRKSLLLSSFLLAHLTSCWCFTTVFICACLHILHSLSLSESPTTSHPFNENWVSTAKVVLDKFFSGLHFLLGQHLHTRYGNWHLFRTFGNLDHRHSPSFSQPFCFCFLFFRRGLSWSRFLVQIFFYMKLVEEPLTALPSCCHLTEMVQYELFTLFGAIMTFCFFNYKDICECINRFMWNIQQYYFLWYFYNILMIWIFFTI